MHVQNPATTPAKKSVGGSTSAITGNTHIEACEEASASATMNAMNAPAACYATKDSENAQQSRKEQHKKRGLAPKGGDDETRRRRPNAVPRKMISSIGITVVTTVNYTATLQAANNNGAGQTGTNTH